MVFNKLISKILIFYYFALRNWQHGEDTIDKCHTILKYDKYDDLVWTIMGDSYRSMDLYDDSLNCYNEILEFANSDFQKIGALNRISELSYEWDYYEETIECLNELMNIEGPKYYSLINMAYCYLYLEEYEVALDYFKKANLIESGNDFKCSFNISKCYYELGKVDESNKIFQ